MVSRGHKHSCRNHGSPRTTRRVAGTVVVSKHGAHFMSEETDTVEGVVVGTGMGEQVGILRMLVRMFCKGDYAER